MKFLNENKNRFTEDNKGSLLEYVDGGKIQNINPDQLSKILEVIAKKEIVIKDLPDWMYNINDGIKLGLNFEELLKAVEDSMNADELAAYIYTNSDPDKYDDLYPDNKELRLRANESLLLDESLFENIGEVKTYNITIFDNTATAERRPYSSYSEYLSEFETFTERHQNDLMALQSALLLVLGDNETTLDDIAYEYDVDIDDEEAIKDLLDDADPSDGSPFIISITEGNRVVYSGYDPRDYADDDDFNESLKEDFNSNDEITDWVYKVFDKDLIQSYKEFDWSDNSRSWIDHLLSNECDEAHEYGVDDPNDEDFEYTLEYNEKLNSGYQFNTKEEAIAFYNKLEKACDNYKGE